MKIEKSEKRDMVSSDAVNVRTEPPANTLTEIRYTTSATGATSGIRYRFTQINLNIGGIEVTFNTKNLVGANPPAGVTEYYDITITRENIIEGAKSQLGRELTASEMESLEDGFKNPGRIDIGATIEIYNAETGKILDVLNSVNDIYDRASKYGFPKKNLDDMASRFKGKPSKYIPPVTDEKFLREKD